MRIIIDKDVTVPAADGTPLATDVYRPDVRDRVPSLLRRTPYSKDDTGGLDNWFDVLRAVRAGYAVVIQDTRGRYRSGGRFEPFVAESGDGADAIAWIAAQPWSDGTVGMIGASYVGATQWLAAARRPPALRAIAPIVTAADYHEGWTYQGGAFSLGFALHWALESLAGGELERRLLNGEATKRELDELVARVDAIGALYDRLPLTDVPELEGLAPCYQDWLAHPDRDDYWRATAPRERYDDVTVPAFNIGGWYDLFLAGTIDNYTGMRAGGGSDRARALQRLVIGPWSHSVKEGTFPEHRYGTPGGITGVDLTGLQLRWFDHVLRGHDNGADRDPPVRVFVMGANIWRDEDDWPLPDTAWTAYYLHSGGRANTASGDGGLSPEPPGDEPPDVFLYDPRDPVPTVGGPTYLPGAGVGANAGPRDQRAVEARHDVLCYTTAPLDRPVEVTGPVTLTAYVSSSAVDTDLTAKLVDVHPDGRAINLTEGILRLRYRDSLSEPRLLEPGRIYEVRVDLWATSAVFAAGHRIRLEVSSSNFPRFSRNTNTGRHIPADAGGDLVPAVNTVHHTRSHPSRLTLPVIDRR